jgi:hypothetical protein
VKYKYKFVIYGFDSLGEIKQTLTCTTKPITKKACIDLIDEERKHFAKSCFEVVDRVPSTENGKLKFGKVNGFIRESK